MRPDAVMRVHYESLFVGLRWKDDSRLNATSTKHAGHGLWSYHRARLGCRQSTLSLTERCLFWIDQVLQADGKSQWPVAHTYTQKGARKLRLYMCPFSVSIEKKLARYGKVIDGRGFFQWPKSKSTEIDTKRVGEERTSSESTRGEKNSESSPRRCPQVTEGSSW